MKTIQIAKRFSFNEWGGTETVIWNVARKLKAEGNSVEIAATSAFDRVGTRTIEDIPIHRFRYFYPLLGLTRENRLSMDRQSGNPYVLGLYRYLLHSDTDLFHCHCMQRIANTVRRAAQQKKIPYIVSFHSGWGELQYPELLEINRPLRFCLNYGGILDYWFQTGSYLDQAAGITCVDAQEYQKAVQRFPHQPVEYLPNGVDIKRFETRTKIDFRSIFAIPPDRYLILCISRIDFSKNQRILLELMRKLLNRHHNPHLVIMGSVSSEIYYEQLVSDVTEYNLGDRVTISRGVRFDDPLLESAYQTADCFVLPSIQEPFGIVVLEAWAAGLPVICSGADGLRRLVTDGQNGLLFNDFSSDDLLHKFELLQKNPELRQRLITTALAEVKQQYSWESVTQRLSDFYQRVIKHYRHQHA